MKALFPIYLSSLKLTDDRGNLLTLDKNGNGSFKYYLATIIKISANNALKDGKDISQFKKAFTIENDKVIAVNLDIYTHIEMCIRDRAYRLTKQGKELLEYL